MSSATIKLFLAQGDPKRLRTAEISNWNGKALAAPRAELDSILARDEAKNAGVYFLTGTDPDSGKGINGFLVLKGSQAVLSERPSTEHHPYARLLRQKLIDEGVLERRNNCLEFIKDTEFTSPSAAASVIHGGNANGLLAWKTEDGRTLKELEAV
jgi:Domain of unknown function (DUF4357)